jgi:hypothetical protein
MAICNKCGKRIGIFAEKCFLTNNGIRLLYHKKCYEKIKQEKERIRLEREEKKIQEKKEQDRKIKAIEREKIREEKKRQEMKRLAQEKTEKRRQEKKEKIRLKEIAKKKEEEETLIIIKKYCREIFDDDREYEYALGLFKHLIENKGYSNLTPDKSLLFGKFKKVFRILEPIVFVKNEWGRIEDIKNAIPKLEILYNEKVEEKSKESDKRFVCSECEYKWKTTKDFGVPFKCPRCNSKKIISFEELRKKLGNSN